MHIRGIRTQDGRMALAVGLLEIGKRWGHRSGGPPDEAGAMRFLESAWDAGVRHFDTAASYADSEERFGRFLDGLTPAQRAEAWVATKFGEHWDAERGEPYVDHSYGALARSLERSLERLGRIDLLQLHKTTPQVLGSQELKRAWALARGSGIGVFGASVKDEASVKIVMATGVYSAVQLPLNRKDTRFAGWARRASEAGLEVLVNRPFGMGRLLPGSGSANRREAVEAAFDYLLRQGFAGMILVGTKSAEHLRENIGGFCRAAGSDHASAH